MRAVRSIALPLLAVLLAAGPASAQSPRGARGPFRVTEPQPSLAFALRLRDHLVQAGVREPTGRVAVWIAAGNRAPRLSLAGTNVPQAVWPSVTPLVDAYVASRTDAAPLELSFYLERLPASATDVGSSAEAPVLRNFGRLADGMRAIAMHSTAYADSGRVSTRTQPGMLVDARGRPALVENRIQGDPEFSRYLSALMYELRFAPARVAGAPVAVWIEGPGGFEVGSRDR